LATVILLVFVLALVAVFSMQNAAPVLITFFFWKFVASLALVIFLSLLSGIIAGAIAVSLLRRKPRTHDMKKDL
jgi:uncharacterized integral membrane protein